MKADRNGTRAAFYVRFWGVRGSYPVSERKKLKFGGHTSCVEVQTGEHRLVFDAGTGIIALGKTLLARQKSPLKLCIFLSHTHHDHLFGLYFFEPLLKQTASIVILGPHGTQNSLRTTIKTAMDEQFFPIGLNDFKAQTEIHSLAGGERIRIRPGTWKPTIERTRPLDIEEPGAVTIDTHKSSAHPRNGVLLYRIAYAGRSVVYATDIEQQAGGYPDVIEFASGTDILIHDAQYLRSEYRSRSNSRVGWGHSTVETAAEVASKAKAKKLVLYHHEPTHDDKTIQMMERTARAIFPAAVAAYEGMGIDLFRDV